SWRVSCGNQFLMNCAAQFNKAVVLMPTTIDTEHLHNPNLFAPKPQVSKVVIGWTGSHSTLKYLGEVESVIGELLKRNSNASVAIICNRRPDLGFPFEFREWNL